MGYIITYMASHSEYMNLYGIYMYVYRVWEAPGSLVGWGTLLQAGRSLDIPISLIHATRRKVAGSNPDDVIVFFHLT
jgi:hypothetical protein